MALVHNKNYYTNMQALLILYKLNLNIITCDHELNCSFTNNLFLNHTEYDTNKITRSGVMVL